MRLGWILKDKGPGAWPKLTGGKGLHLIAPLDLTIDHDQARACAKQIALRLAATAPDRYTISAPETRTGRIFIELPAEWLRHNRHRCLVAVDEDGIYPDAFEAAAQIAHATRPAFVQFGLAGSGAEAPRDCGRPAT